MQLSTPRLLLRPGVPDDAHALTEAMGDHAVVSQLAHVPWPYSHSDALAFIESMQRDELPRFLIFETLDSGSGLVGGCGVSRPDGHLKLGYWVARQCWGRGIATEAVAALLETVRSLGSKQIYAEHKPENVGSMRVLIKLGFDQVNLESPDYDGPKTSSAAMVMRSLKL